MEPSELQALVVETERAWQAIGHISYGPTQEELPSLKFRRTLYITEDLQAGDLLTAANLRAIRPGGGLPPKYISQFLGCRVSRAVTRGTPVSWDLLGERK